MKKIEVIKVEREICTEVTCNKCNKTVTSDDIMEFQEFFSYSTTAGYGSKFIGDMNNAEIDLCEKCFYELLGPYLKITSQDNW